METHEKSTHPPKSRKKRKEITLKTVDIPLNFRPPILPENANDELQITQVLDYSESDFPLLGSKAFKNKPRNHKVRSDETASRDNAANHTEDNSNKKLSKKVLKSNKHKEAFRIQFEEIFSNSCDKSAPKHRIKPVKHYREDISLGRNPLDSDNPTRQKGVIDSKPKVKRISRTKAMVFKAREEMQQLKEAAKYISIKDNEVRVDKEISIDELWKPLCLLKTSDVKKCLQSNRIQSEIKAESDDDEVEPQLSDIENENLTKISEIAEEDLSNICTIPLDEALKDSEISPYQLLIHNNNFKRYCDNYITSELNDITEKLIGQLVRYQHKKYQIDPVKAIAKKRYVLGLRQVKKFTKMNKTKLIIFVPNMEESMHEAVEELKSLAVAYSIPYLFAFTRKKLGKLAYKKIGVCCFGILDYSGAEENFKTCIEVLKDAKKIYTDKCADAKNHYEQHFGYPLVNNTAADVGEEIRTDFISKLSLSDGEDEDNEADNNISNLDDS